MIRKSATGFIGVQAGSLLPESFPASTVLAMSGIVIKPRARIFHGHDWVYASEIRKLFGDPKAGDVISLKDYRDRPLGTAIYNPDSQIVARQDFPQETEAGQRFFPAPDRSRQSSCVRMRVLILSWRDWCGVSRTDCRGDRGPLWRSPCFADADSGDVFES